MKTKTDIAEFQIHTIHHACARLTFGEIREQIVFALSKLTVAELRIVAAGRGITLTGRTRAAIVEDIIRRTAELKASAERVGNVAAVFQS